jgi:ketosteroid isomerase-like protein
MSTSETARFDLDALRRAIEARDAGAQASMFADDADIRMVDKDNPPSSPREIRGRDAIAALFEDICNRDMTHEVQRALMSGDTAAFSEACQYADGTRVQLSTILDLRDGRIRHAEMVQAWDD